MKYVSLIRSHQTVYHTKCFFGFFLETPSITNANIQLPLFPTTYFLWLYCCYRSRMCCKWWYLSRDILFVCRNCEAVFLDWKHGRGLSEGNGTNILGSGLVGTCKFVLFVVPKVGANWKWCLTGGGKETSRTKQTRKDPFCWFNCVIDVLSGIFVVCSWKVGS